MQQTTLTPRQARLSYFCAFAFIAAMVAAAAVWNDREIVLPEIAAMAIALWVYREPGWMRHPEKIFLWPTATALMGFGINLLAIPYTAKLALVLAAMLLFFLLLRYSLAPALATGFLPVVTNATEPSFIAAIVVSTLLLMLGVMLGRLRASTDRTASVQPRLMAAYAAIILAGIGLAALAGNTHLAVLPPVAVVVYESLHMKMYSWRMLFKQTAVLTLSAAVGVALYLAVEDWMTVVLLDLALMWLLLRLFEMRMPAVYAFPLLAYVFPRDALPQLPAAALLVSLFSLTLVMAYRKLQKPAMALERQPQ